MNYLEFKIMYQDHTFFNSSVTHNRKGSLVNGHNICHYHMKQNHQNLRYVWFLCLHILRLYHLSLRYYLWKELPCSLILQALHEKAIILISQSIIFKTSEDYSCPKCKSGLTELKCRTWYKFKASFRIRLSISQVLIQQYSRSVFFLLFI